MDKVSGMIGGMTERTWWNRENRPFDSAELMADAIVHVIGLMIALALGSTLLFVAATRTAPGELPALALYVGSLVLVLAASFAFNMWPICPLKRHLARLDQAAIFVFLAGSYTPFLSLLDHAPFARLMLAAIWGTAALGVILKLFVPQRFGRIAIPLYLAIGWSGLLIFEPLAAAIPETTLWLLLAGGVTYSVGVMFHFWERLRFQNAMWHIAVVAGASLHLGAILDCMVISRL